ncbi:MAG: TlpA family protein disulfide reductase [Ignavibacteria bacterium]|nr:TlpA family protein disulfide reductase [Ignavibacteria bacterium]
MNSQELNSKAPEFSMTDLNGNTIDITGLKGKVILIDFWASWCVPCKKSMPHIIELYNNRTDSLFTVIAVNVDEDKSKIEEFAKSINTEFPFPVIFDKESRLPSLYNVEGMPTTFIIDKEGIIRFKETGFTAEVKEKMDSKLKELLTK